MNFGCNEMIWPNLNFDKLVRGGIKIKKLTSFKGVIQQILSLIEG